jgi:hypothetical protein
MTDMQTSLPLLIVWPSILNLVIHFSTQPLTSEIKCPRLYLCLGHSIPTPPMSMQHMHQHDQQRYDPLHIIMWSYWFIDLDFTCSSPLRRFNGANCCSSFTVTRGPSFQSLWLALHACNQSIKLCLDLLYLDHMTQFHVSCAMSSFITCVSLAPSSSHLHRHGICCSNTCTCGLITCVSHINTISPPNIVTQLPKPNKDLSISPFLVIDDSSTKIWKLSSFVFMLLAQAILPCVNDFRQVPQTRIGSISSPYICAIVFGSKLAHMHELKLWESNNYQRC